MQNFERDDALSVWLWRSMTILSYWIGRSDRSLKLVFLFFSCFWRLIWYEVWMMIPQVKYSYPCLIPSKGCWEYFNHTLCFSFIPVFILLFFGWILAFDDLMVAEQVNICLISVDIFHELGRSEVVWSCMYFAAHLFVGTFIVAFVVGWTNFNEMAVTTPKYSSSTDQITCLSLKIEIDLYADYPAEPSHLKSL